VEEIKPIDLKIARRFFTKREHAHLLEWPEALRTERFFELWTMKESYIKLKGAGLSLPLSSFDVLDENGAWYYRFIKNNEVTGHISLQRHGPVSNGAVSIKELLEWAGARCPTC
jgi:phosphopantetheine--protein transferase-like protein